MPLSVAASFQPSTSPPPAAPDSLSSRAHGAYPAARSYLHVLYWYWYCTPDESPPSPARLSQIVAEIAMVDTTASRSDGALTKRSLATLLRIDAAWIAFLDCLQT
ncbi:hypothetical protein ACN47E_006445 [Coniothyrium glycines]